jgi:hypothetical protein
VGDRPGEDARIGGHAHHVVMGGQAGQAARPEPIPAQVVQPDRDSSLAQRPQRVGHCHSFRLAAGSWSARYVVLGSQSRFSITQRDAVCRRSPMPAVDSGRGARRCCERAARPPARFPLDPGARPMRQMLHR